MRSHVKSTLHNTWWGCEEISIGKSQKGTNSFLFHFLAQSLLPPSYSSPFTWFFFCNLDYYPSALSHSRGKKEKLDVLVWLLWFPNDDAQKQLARVPSLYARSLRITTRNYLTRITLQTPGGDWRSTGGCELNGWWFIYVRCKFAGTCVFHRRHPMDCVRAFPTFDGCLVFLSSVGLLTCFVFYLKSRSLRY